MTSQATAWGRVQTCSTCGDELRFDGVCFNCTRADRCKCCRVIHTGAWAIEAALACCDMPDHGPEDHQR